MEAKNFRLGNLLYNTEGNVDKINIEALKYLLEYGGAKMCQAKPIEVNEEWLTKFGFEKKKGSISYDKDKLSLYFGDTILSDKNGRTYWNSWAIMEKTPNYIHELQNLFFALTGTELELNTDV